MKQKARLDFLLNELYKSKSEDQMSDIYAITDKMPDDINRSDAKVLAERLYNLDLIKLSHTKSSLRATLTSIGIEYCEEDSFTEVGKPVINHNYNLTISNSPNSNIVNQSKSININSKIENITYLIDEISNTINQDSKVTDERKENIDECTKEIKLNLEKNNIPKFGIKSLLNLLSDIASVSSLVLSLSEYV
ncbi:hypothetical protein JM83_3205 [Gillisia sp. Hel_I_86]|uniref:hypothetical protein n=1 Tax=Gillisia sp. Hel_I_86 TaxID=1249981 RepID=UPI001198EC34|nr:hypothetical protein [Gillisia sp. Hel_I_86]TVZ28105.1 hypothetical protein JM83_3205 [Gillisia sp. Hel_I_86]